VFGGGVELISRHRKACSVGRTRRSCEEELGEGAKKS
jgi:hypothetical protein